MAVISHVNTEEREKCVALISHAISTGRKLFATIIHATIMGKEKRRCNLTRNHHKGREVLLYPVMLPLQRKKCTVFTGPENITGRQNASF